MSRRPRVWYRNAALRALRSLWPGLARPDDGFARARLSDLEYGLYRTMDPRDREHAERLTRALLRRRPDASSRLVRAALLHDLGKVRRPFRLHERILVHLVDPGEVPAEPLRRGPLGAWQVKRHHPRYGARLLRESGGCEAVARLIEIHHDPGGDPDAELLKTLDERT